MNDKYFCLFERKIKRYLKIFNPSRITKNSLDPEVFDFPELGTFDRNPTLAPHVITFLMSEVYKIVNHRPIYVEHVYLVGPILKRNSPPNSFGKVILLLNTKLFDQDLKGAFGEMILRACKEASHKLLIGTRHPIIYVPTIHSLKLDAYPAVYSLTRNEWLKLPN